MWQGEVPRGCAAKGLLLTTIASAFGAAGGHCPWSSVRGVQYSSSATNPATETRCPGRARRECLVEPIIATSQHQPVEATRPACSTPMTGRRRRNRNSGPKIRPGSTSPSFTIISSTTKPDTNDHGGDLTKQRLRAKTVNSSGHDPPPCSKDFQIGHSPVVN